LPTSILRILRKFKLRNDIMTKEFPNVFREKKKKVWHVTTATHNSRYSQRMFDNHVVRGEAEWFDTEDAIIITETVKDIAISDKLNILEYNICGDHMHILLVCEEEELPKIVGKIKSVTAKIRNRKRGYTDGPRGHAPLTDDTCETSGTTMGHAPLSDGSAPLSAGSAPISAGEAPLSAEIAPLSSGGAPISSGGAAISSGGAAISSGGAPISVDRAPISAGEAPLSAEGAPLSVGETPLSVASPRSEKERGKTQRQVWTQKFGKAEVTGKEYLANAIKYIRDNRIKHKLPRIIEIENLKKEFLCTLNQAFRLEYKGGFDVVIGNPPYGSVDEKSEGHY
jgi:REP element-mobilizing transposase RayT